MTDINKLYNSALSQVSMKSTQEKAGNAADARNTLKDNFNNFISIKSDINADKKENTKDITGVKTFLG